MSIQRQPKGIPVGGQFAANSHDEASPLFPEPEYETFSGRDISEAGDAAREALLWSSSEAETFSDENPGVDITLDDSSQAYLNNEIDDFYQAYPELVHAASEAGLSATDGSGFSGAFGHDFVLDRSGSGTGFWDRDSLSENGLGEIISQRLSARGEIDDLSIDEDGTAHIYADYTVTRTKEADEALESALSSAKKGGSSEESAASDARTLLRDAGLYRYLSYRGRRRLDDALGLPFDRKD